MKEEVKMFIAFLDPNHHHTQLLPSSQCLLPAPF